MQSSGKDALHRWADGAAQGRILGFQLRDVADDEPGQLRRNEAEPMELFAIGGWSRTSGAAFPLSDAGAALHHVTGRKAIGKVVLSVR